METVIRPDLMEYRQPKGFDAGISQVILFDILDETKKTGSRTRIVKFSPGARTSIPFIHDYEEEVLLLEGDQQLLSKETLEPLERFEEGTYFHRPAGTYHGPFSSENGCYLLEVHYYR